MKIVHAAPGYNNPLFPGSIRQAKVRFRQRTGTLNAASVKLAADLLMSAVLLIILAPVMLTIALFVALDGGPVLYRHRRIGRGGQYFDCLKFRSMRVGADEILARRLAEDPAMRDEWTHTQKLRSDPRVTGVGRFLRATSLDELPQIFNVLRLDMSLVGPRPIVENELARYGRNVEYYLAVRPGVTGLWQVSGRSNTTYSRRVALDAWYVKNWQFWLDIAILFRTVAVVARRDGAH